MVFAHPAFRLDPLKICVCCDRVLSATIVASLDNSILHRVPVPVQGVDMVYVGFCDATCSACGGSEGLKMGLLGPRRCDSSYLQRSACEQTHCVAMGFRFIPFPERVPAFNLDDDSLAG